MNLQTRERVARHDLQHHPFSPALDGTMNGQVARTTQLENQATEGMR
jgi:hypothetical protein